MKITGVIYEGSNRYIHDAVFFPCETKEFRELLHDKNSWVHGFIGFRRSSDHMVRLAARAAYIEMRSKANFNRLYAMLDESAHPIAFPFDDDVHISLESIPRLTEEQKETARHRFREASSCAPNQGVGNSGEGDYGVFGKYNCDQYRICPWCRYKKARMIFEELEPYLNPDTEVCVTSFMSLCDSSSLSINVSRTAYEKISRSIRDRRDWICDYLITLPWRIPVSEDSSSESRLCWRTSLIAIVPKGQALELPEYLAPKKLEEAAFLSDGVVYRYPGTNDGLKDAMQSVMQYPKWMLSAEPDASFAADMLTVALAGDVQRAVPHGLPRGDGVSGEGEDR